MAAARLRSPGLDRLKQPNAPVRGHPIGYCHSRELGAGPGSGCRRVLVRLIDPNGRVAGNSAARPRRSCDELMTRFGSGTRAFTSAASTELKSGAASRAEIEAYLHRL